MNAAVKNHGIRLAKNEADLLEYMTKPNKTGSPAAGHAAPRNKDQSIGVWLNESIVLHPEKIDSMAEDLARSGYGIVRVMLRNTNFNHRSPQVVESVRRLVASAHAGGMRVVLDCEPHAEPAAHDMGSLFPKAIGARVLRAEAPVVDGRFVLHIPAPNGLRGSRADFHGVEAAYLKEGAAIHKLEDFSFERRILVEPYWNGFTRSEHVYTEGRPYDMRLRAYLSGKLNGIEKGGLVVYARFIDLGMVDFWSPDMRRYYDELLECYRGIPLDGVGWDEPAFGGDWNSYLYGDGFASAFERLNGYKLADNWHLLDEPGVTPDAARVRMDYYRTLNDGLFDAQRYLFKKARELFGANLLLGTHHTWQGEAGINDYRAGAVDYFRLSENMDAGYTDCFWWDIKSVCYAYTLASSLGRLSPSGEAEVNTWDTKPTNSRVEYHTRLMTLLDVTWFLIWYGEATDTCLYPADYTWPTTVREMNRHRDGQRIIGTAKPAVEIAILHGWETVCAVNSAGIASAHKTFCLNTAGMLVDRSVPFDWLDTRLLSASTVEGCRLVNALGSYSILVLPYASILPREAWEKTLEFARAGGKAVFTGAPPEMDTEGLAIREEFAEIMDMPVLPLELYLAGIESVCTLPAPNRPDRLDVYYPIEGEQGRVLLSIEQEPHGIRSPKGNVIYLSDLDPRQRLLEIIEPWLSPEVTCYSDSIQWRLYRDGDRSLLVCIARQDAQLRGLIRWAGHEVEFRAGTSAFVENRAGELNIRGEGLDWRILQRGSTPLAS